MNNKNWLFVLLVSLVSILLGYFISWYICAGVGLGISVSVFVYLRYYDLIDGIESEIGWLTRDRDDDE